MTVKALMLQLTQFPAEMEVFIGPRESDFACEPVEKVKKEKMKFREDPDGKTLATDTVVVITGT